MRLGQLPPELVRIKISIFHDKTTFSFRVGRPLLCKINNIVDIAHKLPEFILLKRMNVK